VRIRQDQHITNAIQFASEGIDTPQFKGMGSPLDRRLVKPFFQARHHVRVGRGRNGGTRTLLKVAQGLTHGDFQCGNALPIGPLDALANTQVHDRTPQGVRLGRRCH